MMNTCRISAFILLLACSLSMSTAQTAAQKSSSGKTVTTSSTSADGITSWKQIPIPPLHQFHPQEPKRVELPNGLVVFLQEDHELPLIDGTFRIRGGSRDVPADKTGLMDIYSEVWRTGGTKSKTGDQLDDELEMKAARVETFDGTDSTFVTWSSLKEDFDQVLPAVLDILQNPEFRQEKIDLAKEEEASFISRRNDDVNQIAQRESTRLAYGPENPYARIPEYDTVASITRDDLAKWHKRTVAPNNMILGVTGDFDAAAMERKLRDTFGKLPKGEPFPVSQISFHDPTPGIYFIEKDDVNQSAIEIVDLGIERRNPDFYAVEVMNELFGGGFSSRLVSSIRTKEGLAYSVGGGVGAAYDHPGVLRISMGTKSGSTAAAIDALNKQIADLVKGGVKQEEIQEAKDAILNSFIFAFDSKEKVLGERMSYEFYGYPPDFLERYRAGIEKVTPEDVNRVAKKYVHPEKLAVLVVGNAKDFDRDLATFGKVTPIDIRIPAAKKAGANSQ